MGVWLPEWAVFAVGDDTYVEYGMGHVHLGRFEVDGGSR